MCNDSRVNKQHIRSSCSKAPVKAKPSFSMTKLHVWAVVTTFFYITSYSLLEPSGTSHDFLIKTIFSEYLRIAIRLKEERLLFSSPEPSLHATPAMRGMGGSLCCSLHCYSRALTLPCAVSMALERPTDALHFLSSSSSSKAHYNYPNRLSSSGVFTTEEDVHGHHSTILIR